MAQNNSSRRGSSGGASGRSASARGRGTNTRSSSAGRSTGSSASRSADGNRSSSRRGGRRLSPEFVGHLGAVILVIIGVVALISLFPAEGVLLRGYRLLMKGLIGWGYYLTPAAFLWAAVLLWTPHEEPVRPRVICILLLPVVFGAFVHVTLCTRDFKFWNDSNLLWTYGQDTAERCGGVIAGDLGILLRSLISRPGAFIVLMAAVVLMAICGANITPLELWAMLLKRYHELNDEDDPEEEENDEDAAEALPPPASARTAREQPEKTAPARSGGSKPAAAPVRRRIYDEDREKQKDILFAGMGIDKSAALRVAAALQEEKKTARPAPKKTSAASAKRSAAPAPEPTAAAPVEPLSVEEAAGIAGVTLTEPADGPAPAKKEKIDKDAEAAAVAEEIEAGAEEKPAYIFPDLSLLNKSDPKAAAGTAETDETESRLEGAIRSFGVGATITGAIHGPTVTRYELRLDQGVKLSKITNLQNDIALSIGVTSVRIAPIPNKISTVGVEVPNREKTTVWLGDVIDSETFRNARSKLSVALGKDIGGNVIVGNIAKMPHVLIAGTTGSGKSVCINSLILSILYKSTPDEVRMIMVDPKQVELGIYNGMPHLYVPVVTDAKKAAGALQWSVVEMLKRYRLFSEVGVRDLAGYNAFLTANDQPILPQVVIIIDELADLMMVAAKEVEESICRVAQMGRAAGMHLVVATQSPRADVITGLMKANIPSRIAFAVSGALESRIILDQQGAEKLLGQGDMLYSPIGIGKPLRVQGAFVTDEEREEIIEFIKRGAEADYSDEILAEIEKAAVKEDRRSGRDDEEDDAPQNDYDELLPQAVDVIFETKQASVSMLQRRLKLGYSRAARLIDQLEEVGVVGPYEGSKPRQILLTKQQWQEMQYSQGTAPVDTIAQEFAAVSEDDSFAAPDEDDDTPAPEPAEEEMPWDEDEEP